MRILYVYFCPTYNIRILYVGSCFQNHVGGGKTHLNTWVCPRGQTHVKYTYKIRINYVGKVGFTGDVPCPTYNIRGKLVGKKHVKYTYKIRGQKDVYYTYIFVPRIIYVYYTHNRVSKTRLEVGKPTEIRVSAHVGKPT